MSDDNPTVEGDNDNERIVKPVFLILAMAIVLVLAVAYVVTTSRDEPGDPAFTGPAVPAVPAPAPDAAEGDAAATGDVLAVAAAAGDFTTLVDAVDAADLTDALEGEGPFTVFAPTDDAFEAALDELGLTADELLADREALATLLSHHVVEGNLDATALVELDGESIETLAGDVLDVGVDGETVTLDGVAVVSADIAASNGIIHVIGEVLVPADLEFES